jgi:hypothetical protein
VHGHRSAGADRGVTGEATRIDPRTLAGRPSGCNAAWPVPGGPWCYEVSRNDASRVDSQAGGSDVANPCKLLGPVLLRGCMQRGTLLSLYPGPNPRDPTAR